VLSVVGLLQAEESGIMSWRRVPALNTNATFIGDLADAVLQALPFAGSMAGSNPGDSLVPLGEACLPSSSWCGCACCLALGALRLGHHTPGSSSSQLQFSAECR
jgi:hypothetical protein